jgi:hypothetical protein
MDWYNRLDVTEKILSAVMALVALSGVVWAALSRLHLQFAPNLQKVMSRSICLPLEKGPSRIFHTQWPYILPVCFKNPVRSEYTYIVVGKSIDDESKFIKTQPHLPIDKISSRLAGNTRWYQLTSNGPLQSIAFEGGLLTESFGVVKTEVYPLGTWNSSPPITVPKGRSRVYTLAITEQLGSSTWFVCIDDYEFTFDHNLGCHFVEFVLQKRQQHKLSVGYKEGALGISCAFFAL